MEVVATHDSKHNKLVKRKGRKEKLIHIWKRLKASRDIYILLTPVIIYFIVFKYVPIYGVIIAFKDFTPIEGISGSEFVGFKHFITFFNSYYFWRLLRNTLLLSVYSIIFAFPMPIILALLLNEIKNDKFKKCVQTITYMPHFISLVVIIGILLEFLTTEGLVNQVVIALGGVPRQWMNSAKYFRPIYILSDIWKTVGWGSVIYLAALSGIDKQLYEAAKIDGANRWRQLLNVTLPCIASTIIIMLILRFGRIMSVGFEKVLLMQTASNMETSEIIATFVYRSGLQKMQFSYASAIGLFNNVINLILIVTANKISKKLSENSLW